MAGRNLDAFCTDLLDDIAEAEGRRSIYDHAFGPKSISTLRPSLRRPITTHGRISPDRLAFVYAAGPRRGLVKIGMSCDVDKRMKKLKIDLIFAIPVAPHLAKLIETEALSRLGQRIGDGEWVAVSPDAATQAIRWAATSVRHIQQ